MLVLVLVSMSAGVSLRTASGASAATYCFEGATPYCAENAFLSFWQTHGGTKILGLPVSAPFRDDRGLIVQFYERAIMEWQPEKPPEYQVLLTLLGVEQLGNRPQRNAPPVPCEGECDYFADTGHTLRGNFRQYWIANGGLAVFGFPITEEFQEISPTNGQVYTVQYFERNRFEWHDEVADPQYKVLLGLLGYEKLQANPGLANRPVVSVPNYDRPVATAPARLAIPRVGVDAVVEPVGQTPSGAMANPSGPWTVAWYAPGTRPGAPGNAVIAGHVDYAGIGPAVFWRLRELAPGDEVWVTADSGARLRFVVQDIQTYYTDTAPLEQIFGPTSNTGLNLISCIGYFDSASGSYDRRIVVYTTWDGVVR